MDLDKNKKNISNLPTLKEIVEKNRKIREIERKNTKERTEIFRRKLEKY